MKIGIIGLGGSGKTTVFETLTHSMSISQDRSESRISTVRVPDKRVKILSEIYKPQKSVYTQIEYLLPGLKSKSKNDMDHHAWVQARDCDALILVIRNFGGYGYDSPDPYIDFSTINQDIILADLMVVEKRLERLNLDKKRGKNINLEEFSLLAQCLDALEKETPLRQIPDLSVSQLLRGYAFISAKPMLVLFNNEDEDDSIPNIDAITLKEDCISIRGKLEKELAQMSEDEAEEFLSEFNISASAMNRAIKRSYSLLGLVTFYTVGKDEVRAWAIRSGTQAVDAADVIHSDIKKGFIRAEVFSYDDFVNSSGYNELKKKGLVRLEGKTYIVKDGDIITFRFNV